MNRKKFDCVEMMHRGQAASEKRLKGMTDDEKLEYWRRRTEEMHSLQRERALQRRSHSLKTAAEKR